MKGIKCCGECAYYSMKKHKCMGGAKDAGKETDSFYADCPHVEAEPVRHGRWIFVGEETTHDGWTHRKYKCSECGFLTVEAINYCQNCGSKNLEV